MGDTLKVQPLACATRRLCPAIVTTASRAGPVLAAAAICTGALPLPLPPVTVIHGAVVAADHAQPALLPTCTLLCPPAAPMARLEGVSEKAHPEPWVTDAVASPMRNAAARPGPLVAATVKRTSPFPVPLSPAVSTIHSAVAVVVHRHPAPARTATTPGPPAGAKT